jgi:hypothetical protein
MIEAPRRRAQCTNRGGATGLEPMLSTLLPTGYVVCEVAMVVARQERHFEPAVCGVLSTNKEPEAEGADRESPRGCFVSTPMADEPRKD